MKDRTEEIARMAAVEDRHWWYRSLHFKTYDAICRHFGDNREVDILDAGCGTGGMLAYLKTRGYPHLAGVDFAPDAVRFCRQKGLNVTEGDIRDLRTMFLPGRFDVIISNDTYSYLTYEECKSVIKDMNALLKPGGVLILNIPMFPSMGGIHDIAVGQSLRLTRKQLQTLIQTSGLTLKEKHYWPFLLSPLIFFNRWLQRQQLKKGQPLEVKSDVSLPPAVINNVLFRILMLEHKFRWVGFFASSCHITLVKSTR